MNHTKEYSYVNSNGAETYMSRHNVNESYNKDSHRRIRDSFKKLQSWREESLREFSCISINVDEGINDLIEENCDLETQLLVATKERNDLIQTVNNLSCEITQLSTKLAMTPLPNSVDTYSLEMEVTNTDQ